MNAKGQIVSMDFLLSLILVTLALGLIFRFSEISTYALEENTLQSTLERLGSTAAEKLLHSPDFACKVGTVGGTTATLFHASNCLDAGKLGALSTTLLGLPAGYSYHLSLQDPAGGPPSEYGIAVPDTDFAFSAERSLVLYAGPGNLGKNTLYNCISGSACLAGTFAEKRAVLTVWRNP